MRLAALLVLALVPALQDGAPRAAWPHQSSDLPADPRIRFGALENGLRFAWMDNAEPRSRSYLRLHVNVGSLAEGDAERGMAHFVEHMAFNGSKSYPAGQLNAWFQKHGMAVGADTNAFTGYSQTIYQLDLPESDEQSLREGLQVLRDFADGLLLEAQEIDAEKKVVDAEERERGSVNRRVRDAYYRTALAGTRIPDRNPIGVKSVRDAFTPESVRAFYERWYRPDNATVILVGDLRGRDPLPLIDEAFASWKKPAEPLPLEPDPGLASTSPRFVAIHDGELTSVAIGLQKISPWRARPWTRAHVIDELPRVLARWMIGLRFAELRKANGAPFLSATTSDPHDRFEAAGIRVLDGEELTIQCPRELWKEALAACEQELRRALQHGFTEDELVQAKAEVERALHLAVERARTQPSKSWVDAIVFAAESQRPPSNEAERRDTLVPALKALDAETCRKALSDAWSRGTLAITFTGPIDLGPDAAEILRATYEASAARPVEARKSTELASWAYPSDPDRTGKIAARVHDREFDVHTVAFDNGVRLFVKQTDFEAGQILASAHFAQGKLDVAPGQSALGWTSENVVEACGLAAHSYDDLRKLFAGKNVMMRYRMATDQFELAASTTQADLVTQCEWLCAELSHAGWRAEGLREFKKRVPLYYDSLQRSHSGPLQAEFMKELYSGDASRGAPPRAEVEAIELPALRAWLEPYMKSGALDVVLVGDLDVDQSIQAVAQTFGMLGPRRRLERREERRKPVELATGLRRTYAVDVQEKKTLVWIVFPATDGCDLETKRVLRFLAGILSSHLMLDMRERLGGAYSPNAVAATSEAIPGDGYIGIEVTLDPAHADELTAAALAVAESLGKVGPTAEQIDAVRSPALTQLRDARRTNRYWWSALSRAHSRTDVFDELRSEEAWLETVDAEKLKPLATKYLKRERASIAIVAPR